MLESIYDQLLGDEAGTQCYASFILEHRRGDSLLELACGSGDLLIALRRQFARIQGIDLSPEMIALAQQKGLNTVAVGNMLDYQSAPYDMVVCVGDSLNYLTESRDVEHFVEHSVQLAKQRIIVDLHHPDRLQEFASGYLEEGEIDQLQYAWQISVAGDRLIHQFQFYQPTLIRDLVVQRIYPIEWVVSLYEAAGCTVEVFPGFETSGRHEKVILVIDKEVL